MLASLFDTAPEVLQKIALFAIADTPLGPPRELLSLTLLCHASHRILSPSSARVYVDIFAQKFDIRGPLARLGMSTLQKNAKLELQRRFFALATFRRGDLDDPALTQAFWIAYLMFEDSDTSQKNVKQLLWAGLLMFLDSFLRNRLYRDSDKNNGWPVPDERNSLAVALFWLSSSQSSISRETPDLREGMLQILGPFVFAAFRYPIFGTAEFCFDLAAFTRRVTTSTVHGPYPPPPLLPKNVAYFGQISRTVHVPSVSLFAALSFFTRQETLTPAILPHLIASNRQTREEADALGQIGPTLDDVDYFIHHCQTHFADFPSIDIGVLHKSLDTSPYLTMGQPAFYKVGTLAGCWQGSYIMPYLESYRDWLGESRAPPIFPTTGRFPLYMTLQEHYTCVSASMVPQVDIKEGTTNAWLPVGFQWTKKENGIEVFDENGTFKTFYKTFQRDGKSNLKDRDVVDVIITGKTDHRHAAAWGEYHLLGRVRLADGLMVLSRNSVNGTGATLLRGYVTSSQNFVGRFKGVSNGTEPSGWEAAFSLCRDHAYHT